MPLTLPVYACGEQRILEGHLPKCRVAQKPIVANLLAKSSTSAFRSVMRFGGAVLDDFPELRHLGAARLLDLGGDIDCLPEELADARKVLLHKATRGHGVRTHPEAVRDHGALVTWDGVLVQDDGGVLANKLRLVAIHALGAQVEEEEMVARASRDKVELLLGKGFPQGLGIL